MTVEELIEALKRLPMKDPVYLFDGVSQRANFTQSIDSVVMAEDLSGVILEAGA